MADQLEPLYRQVISSGKPILNLEVHGTNRAQPDSERDWLVSFYPQKDADERVLGVNVMVQEITERKQALSALQESGERFRTLADNMSQFAWMADESGWIFWYNHRWFEYTGTTLEEMQGWGWRKVHHPEHVERVVERIRHRSWVGLNFCKAANSMKPAPPKHWQRSSAMPSCKLN